MEFNKKNIIPSCTRFRMEDGKKIKYVITNDSYQDEYGCYQMDYNAWRIQGRTKVKLTSSNYFNSQSQAESCITFGKYVTCKCCGATKFVEEKYLDE